MGGPSPFVGRSGAVYGRPQAPRLLDDSGLPPALLPYLRGFAGLPGLSPQMIQRMITGRFMGTPSQFAGLQLPPEVLAQLSHILGITIPITPTPGQPVTPTPGQPVTPTPGQPVTPTPGQPPSTGQPPTTTPLTPPPSEGPVGPVETAPGPAPSPKSGPKSTPSFAGEKELANVPDKGSSDLDSGKGYMGGKADLGFGSRGTTDTLGFTSGGEIDFGDFELF